MHLIQASTFNKVYPAAVEHVLKHGREAAPRGKPIREQQHAIINVSDPHDRLVTARPVNVAFALAEVIWILAGRRDVAFVQPFNSSIGQFSDDGVVFNAAYGYRLRKNFGFDQIQDVVQLLSEDPDSRQAVLQTWDPNFDSSYTYHPGAATPMRKRETKDRACNTQSQLLLRDGKLHWMQLQRSNDLIWGTPYNYMQFSHLQKWIADMLGVEVGEYTHVVNSLHIYTEDYAGLAAAEQVQEDDLWELTETYCDTSGYDWGEPSTQLVEDLVQLVEMLGADNSLPASEVEALPPYWESAIRIMDAHISYKLRGDTTAIYSLANTSVDPVQGAAQARFYWLNRWSKEDSEVMFCNIHDLFPKPIAEWITR